MHIPKYVVFENHSFCYMHPCVVNSHTSSSWSCDLFNQGDVSKNDTNRGFITACTL